MRAITAPLHVRARFIAVLYSGFQDIGDPQNSTPNFGKPPSKKLGLRTQRIRF